MQAITYRAIGVIYTPWTEMAGMPLQSVAAQGVAGTIDVLPAYAAGLRDIAGVSHLILLYHLHRMTRFALEVTPYIDTATHGIFATRSPKCPNPIGFSIVRLVGVGITQTIPLAIFQEEQASHLDTVSAMSAVLVCVSFAILVTVKWLTARLLINDEDTFRPIARR